MIWCSFKKLKKLWFVALLACAGLAGAGSYNDFFNAITQDDSSQVKALLTRGFDGNTLDPTGQTGLHLALGEPSFKAGLALLDWPKIDVNRLNARGESALMLAALKGQTEFVKKLIEKKADVNKTDWTPLHYAASAGRPEIISLLIENHAYIDAESPNRTTPLMMAARYGSTASVQLLLDQDADPGLRNQQGLTALDFAKQGDKPDAVKAIASRMKKLQSSGKW